MIVVVIHEAAHALTTKHYMRKVRLGGMLMYFGSPAFFVDTMDIWMEPKKSRIAVSWAGPYSGLLLGSIAMFVVAATGFADTGSTMFLNSLLFKLALVGFVFGALMNLNPLLEWDGYFILMDWLEIPILRKRSMDFVKRNMLNKMVRRESFSREEKIFSVFGVMAFVYTVLAVVVGLFFWQSRVGGRLGKIGDLSGWVFWLLIGLIVVVIGIPISMALGNLLYRLARRLRLWLYQRFFMGRPRNQVTGLGIAAVALALPALLLRDTTSDNFTVVAGALVLAIGLIFSIRLVPWYLGSSRVLKNYWGRSTSCLRERQAYYSRLICLLTCMNGTSWPDIVGVGRQFTGQFHKDPLYPQPARLQWFFLAIPILMGLLFVAQVLRPFDGSLSASANVVAHGVVPVALLIALAIFSPNIVSFTRTVLQGSWGLQALGVAFLLIGALVSVLSSGDGADTYVNALDLLGYGIFTAALYRFHHRVHSLRPEHPSGVAPEAASDAQRLSSAARFLVEGILEQFAQIHGRRALHSLEEQFNAASAAGDGRSFSLSPNPPMRCGHGVGTRGEGHGNATVRA